MTIERPYRVETRSNWRKDWKPVISFHNRDKAEAFARDLIHPRTATVQRAEARVIDTRAA